jgi:hypothetical protein
MKHEKIITMLKKIVAVIAVIAIFTGCTKDPSLVGPKDAYSTVNYPATLDGLNSVLAPCYSNLRDPELFGFHFLPKVMASCTHVANSTYDGDPDWNAMTNTNQVFTNVYANEAWQALYTGVKNCNVALAGADFFTAHYAKPADAGAVAAVKGQAYFLRAYYYFELESLYGEDNILNPGATDTLGVPIFDGSASSLANAARPRSSIKSVWAFVEKDLQQAATLLKGVVWTGNDLGRASEWAAKGLLGKAYVFTKEYANAKTVLLDVINNSGKTLMPYAKYRDAFIGISANEFNEESLFELNVDQDAKGNDYGVYGNHAANATTINGLIWSPFALGTDGTETGAQPMGYGNEVIHDQNVLRFGFNIGTYNLVPNTNYSAGYDPAKSGYISKLWPKTIIDPVYLQKSLDVRTNKTADPRLYVNTLQPWVDSVMPDGKNWYRVSKSNDGRQANVPTVYGWQFRKYAPIFNNINANGGPADGANIYLLRLADVYLLYAEACAKSSDVAGAVEYLNKVKRRAYGYPINGASPVDYASLTSQTSAFSAGDPVLGTNPLYYERWAELFNEGQWWFDVCRWHIGQSEAAFYGTAINVNGQPFAWDNKKSYAWPIPNLEINSNGAIAGQQNPNY